MKIILTPELAAELLASNENWRSIERARVNRYARDVAAGRWPYTGEAIKKDPSGRLTDGFHRCEAVVLANQSIEVELIEDVPEAATEYMDQGLPRKLHDALRRRGEADAKSLQAAIVLDYRWAKNGGHPHHRPTPSTPEGLAWLADHEDIRGSLTVGWRFYRALRVNKTVGSVFYLKTSRLDVDTATAFVDQVTGDGAGLDRGSGILALRNWLTNHVLKAPSMKPTVGVIAAQFVLGWNAWIEGREVAHLRMRPGKFPTLLDIDGQPAKF